MADLDPRGPRPVYLLWSHKHNAWWRPDGWGYTDNIDDAGRFAERDAVRYVVRSAQCGVLEHVTSMVAAPDNWQRPVSVSPDAVIGGAR